MRCFSSGPRNSYPRWKHGALDEVVVLACLAVASGPVIRQLMPGSLSQNPISACVVGVLGCVVLSHLSHGAIGEAIRCGLEFFKVALYYFLLVAIVDSSDRYRRFLVWITLFVIILTTMSVLQYHQRINIEAIEPYHERQDEIDPVTNQSVVLARLKYTGLYDNPNDLSRILGIGIILGFYLLNDRSRAGFEFCGRHPLHSSATRST